jgi:pimeloyl-ACP methyl ester carboxylesterase
MADDAAAPDEARARLRLAKMDWDEFETTLRVPAGTRGVRAAADADAAERVFDPGELAELRMLAASAARQRTRGPLAGNVVYLPGIMGSTLVTRHKKGDEDLVWINYFRIANGTLMRLKLARDGNNQHDKEFTVRAADVDKKTYAKAVLSLRGWWDVATCPFDWRRDIDAASDALRDLIVARFPNRPVHLVAHSMGGLVARNFIRRHPDVWQGMRAEDGSGGRLVMLGTPNYGSFAIPQVLTGVEKMVQMLARADLWHDLGEVLSITNSFVGSYQMLPAPDRINEAARAMYRLESWGKTPDISEDHLERAAAFHRHLETPRTVDPERMVYVAGFGRDTLSGLSVVAPGEFDYSVTRDGDGRVPHALGLLKGVPTFYVDEGHGSLPGNARVIAAMDELLRTGRTTGLAIAPGSPRMLRALRTTWTRATDEREAGDELSRIARRVQRGTATEEEVRRGEEVLRRATAGADDVALPLAAEPDRVSIEVDDERRVRLTVAVAHGDVTRVDTSLLVLATLKGVPPTRALAAVDKALGRSISRVLDRGLFACGTGEVFHVPVGDVVASDGGKAAAAARPLTASNVLLAGMGAQAQFTRDDVRFLLANVTASALLLRAREFATLPIGAGSLPRERVVRGILEGVCDVLSQPPLRGHPPHSLKRITIVDRKPESIDEIVKALQAIQKDRSIPELDLTVELPARELPAPSVTVGTDPIDQLPPPAPGVRITVTRAGDEFEFSALTDNAVIPVRRVKVQKFFTDGTAERLMDAATRGDQQKFGRLLNIYLMPEDLLKQLSPGTPLTMVLDRTTAAFPWEMACFKSTRGFVFFGPELQLTRQFRTTLSSAPGLPPSPERTLRVLVVADPAPEPELQLPGAREEGRAVVRRLREHRSNEFSNRSGIKIEVTDRIGPGECDPVEVLALVLSEEFDIIHFAGHGFFNDAEPDLGGWVFGRDRTLTAREIFRSRGRTPRLVFANACYSAVVNPNVPAADVMGRQLAGLVEAFFERGIANYVGAGWPVGDAAAVTFASTFYDLILRGQTLGEAMSQSRRAILSLGSTWGAYQHYGQVHTRLVAPGGGGGGGGGSSPAAGAAPRRPKPGSRPSKPPARKRKKK